jgi:hypothetical protein
MVERSSHYETPGGPMGDTPGGPDVPQDYLVLGKMIYEFMPGSQDEMEVEFELDPEE